MPAVSTPAAVLGAIICAYVLMQAYLNSLAYTQSCDSATTASRLNVLNAALALIVLGLLLWGVRGSASRSQGLS